ncbi:MAG: biphenyl 2,3-dioxygenase [Candidatus Rokubacteria bacterium]|nr:biphenyl 2,3-dioxygenase [Candidatus Rokubacteria bacterium]
MKKLLVLMFAGALLSAGLVWAEGDLSRQTPAQLKVFVGAKDNEFTFMPNTWNLETGKLYKVTLVNEGKVKHEWTAPEFALTIWTRKVEVGGVEVKGVINEIELAPGAKAEWYFVPIRTGQYEMGCEIEGHRQAGMIGKVIVK